MFSAIEVLINKALTLDPKSKDRLRMLSGKHVKIEIRNLMKFAVEVTFTPEGVQISFLKLAVFDAIIHGSLLAFITLAVTKDPHQAAKLGLNFEGNVEVAQNVQALFMDLDIDWEEPLSKYTSDSFAHSVGQLFRKAKQHQTDLFTSFTESFKDYVQEENQILPNPKEAEAFYQDIEDLRDQVERTAARLSHIEARVVKTDTAKTTRTQSQLKQDKEL